MPTIDYDALAEKSTFVWAIKNIRLPKSMPWDFVGREWQVAILDDDSKHIVVKKPTQIGLTTIFLTKLLHFADLHEIRAMYTLPRQDDVFDLVNSKLQVMIDKSPYLLAKLGGINNVRLKQFNNSFIHFMEASVTPRMLDADWVAHDEVDMSDQDNLEQYTSRIDASAYAHRHQLSTPTIHDFGIDKLYKASDQKKWIVKCRGCGREQELIWESNVKHHGDATWYGCEKCDRSLSKEDISSGRWVATGNRGALSSGYQVNQMMVSYLSPSKLWEDYQTMTTKNFYNLRLGESYTPTVGSITKESIFENCFSVDVDKAYGGSGYYLGCDQGNVLHVAIGRKVDEKIEIVYLAKIPFTDGFGELERLMEAYGIRQAVLDGLPNRHSAFETADKFPGRIVTAFYSTIDVLYKETPEQHKVNINKTDSFDHLRTVIVNGGIQFYGTIGNLPPEVDEAVTHLSNMRRDELTQKTALGGERVVGVWVNTGPDHFADAINYLQVAVDMGSTGGFRVSSVGGYKKDSTSLEIEENPSRNPYANKQVLPFIRKRKHRYAA